MNDTQIWPTEPRMYIDENSIPHNERAERLNGRLAMLGDGCAWSVCIYWSNYSRSLVMPGHYGDKKKPTKKLSPGQKKIASKAGNPNKIEKADFSKLRKMK